MDPILLNELLAKVGGKYKLVTLFQKRTRELMRGLPPLVEAKKDGEGGQWDVVAREILAGKVILLVGEEAEKYRKELAAKESEELLLMAAKAEKKPKPEAAAQSEAGTAVEAPAAAVADPFAGTGLGEQPLPQAKQEGTENFSTSSPQSDGAGIAGQN